MYKRQEIKCGATFEENSLEDILVKVADLIMEEKKLRSALNKEKKDLHIKTKELIESLTCLLYTSRCV